MKSILLLMVGARYYVDTGDVFSIGINLRYDRDVKDYIVHARSSSPRNDNGCVAVGWTANVPAKSNNIGALK